MAAGTEVIAGIEVPRRRYRSNTRQLKQGVEAGIAFPPEVLGALEELERVEGYLAEARQLTEQRREEYRRWVTDGKKRNAMLASETPPAEFEPIVPKYDIDGANAVLAAYEDAARDHAAALTQALRDNAPAIWDSLKVFWNENVAFTPRADWKWGTVQEKQAAVAEKKAAALTVHQQVMADLYGLSPDQKDKLKKADDLVDPYKLIEDRKREQAERRRAEKASGRRKARIGTGAMTDQEKAAYQEKVRQAAAIRHRQNVGVGGSK